MLGESSQTHFALAFGNCLSLVMGKNHNDSPSCEQEKESLGNDTPMPVSPAGCGEGSPYAPENWPNLGDIWGWKVGKRINRAGYYQDRYLYLPESLQKQPSHRKDRFQSKPEVERYLKRNFPNTDQEEFFAKFFWKVPSKKSSLTKAESVSVPLPVKSLEIKNEETEETPVWRKRKRNTESYRRSTRKSQSSVFPPIEEDAGVNYEFCSINKEASIESDQLLSCDDGSENLASSNEGSDDILTPPEISPNGITVENVDECFNSLEDIFTLPDTETSLNNPVMRNIALENEKTESQKKLSTLLAMDFPSLLSSDNRAELSILVSQLREDPSLTVDQLTNLKLVEEIPFIQEAFLKAKGNIEQADKFFDDLEAKKDKVTCLEKEYGELKGKVAEIQTEIDSSTLEIQELDDQILQLQSKRDAVLSSLETKQKIKVDLTSTQTRLTGSILSIVHEIELGLSEKPKWEVEKIKSAQLKAEILDKFVTLRGLTF